MVENREELYQKEQNQLFESFLDRYYFQSFRGEVETETTNGRMIELFIKGSCSSGCKYCYLIKHSKELYPTEYQSDEQILENLRAFCRWFIKNKFTTNIVFFTGEIIKSGFLFKILDVFLEYFSDPTNPYRPRDIIYPENCDFLEDENLTEKVQEYIDKFKAIDLKFAFSLSIDGKYMDENRNKDHKDEFYKRVGEFADKNFFGFHPMVSAFNIDKWIENYKWWSEGEDIPKALGNYLMMLEVRDNNWTDEAIEEYLKFLNFLIDYNFERNGRDISAFAERAFMNKNILRYYDNISIAASLPSKTGFDNNGLSCSVQKNLCIRLGDMAIVPCHRTSYDKYVTGYFDIDKESGDITGYIGKNVEALISVYSWSKDSAPWCRDCDVKYWCPGPCLGSNYECNGDMFQPPESVCRLYHARTAFLLMKYEEMGVYEEAKKKLPKEQIELIDEYYRKLRSGMGKYDQIIRTYIDDEEASGGRASTVCS